jgi:hypothetical protein
MLESAIAVSPLWEALRKTWCAEVEKPQKK